MLGFPDGVLLEQFIYSLLICFCTFLSVFSFYIVKGGCVRFLLVDAAAFECLVGEGIIEQSCLRNDVLYIELTAKQLFFRDVSVGIKRFVSIVFQLFVEFIAYDVVAADMLYVERDSLKNLFDSLVIGICSIDFSGCFFAFLCAILQVACHFYADFVKGTIGLDDFIHHIDHLIENLLNDRIPKTILGQYVQMVFQFFLIDLVFGQ